MSRGERQGVRQRIMRFPELRRSTKFTERSLLAKQRSACRPRWVKPLVGSNPFPLRQFLNTVGSGRPAIARFYR